MNIIASIEDFVLHKAVGRAVVAVANLAASVALAHSGLLSQYGVSVSVNPNDLAAAIMGGLTVVEHWVGAKIAGKAPGLAAMLGASVVTAPAPAPAAK